MDIQENHLVCQYLHNLMCEYLLCHNLLWQKILTEDLYSNNKVSLR